MSLLLKQFNTNESEKEAVKVFLIETLGVMAIEKTFNGETTTGIKDARELIDKMFDKLDELYPITKEPVEINSR